jgi:hypothetical protein
MSEITIGSIIKILLGLAVVAAVGYGLYYLFSNYIFDSFKNMGLNASIKSILVLL